MKSKIVKIILIGILTWNIVYINGSATELLENEIEESYEEKKTAPSTDDSSSKDMIDQLPTKSQIQKSSSLIKYQSHVQQIGWQEARYEGGVSGTIAQAKRLEAIKIENVSPYLGNIRYSIYKTDLGWQQEVSNNQISGSTGEGKAIEAIKIFLDGELETKYDIYYRLYVQNYRWLGWAKNGEVAGTTGYQKRVEAIQIELVEKGGKAPQSSESAYKHPTIQYQSHIQQIGWQEARYEGGVSGTIAQAKRLEAIKIKNASPYAGNIKYSIYRTDLGWQQEVSNNQMAGSTGQGKAIEAIKISLDGELETKYDIYYRLYVQHYGWLGWAKNGEVAGTTGYQKRVEAIQIELVEKGGKAPESSESAYKHPTIQYQSHIQQIGWQDIKYDGALSGTVGQGKRLEAIKIENISPYSGNIKYSIYREDLGWQQEVSNNQMAGSTGEGKAIEAIKISLDGELEAKYDIYYRVQVAHGGFLDWTKNGEVAGTIGLLTKMEAIEIKCIPKGEIFTEKTDVPAYYPGEIEYASYIQNDTWQQPTNMISGTVAQSKQITAIKMRVLDTSSSIHYSIYKNSKWQTAQDNQALGEENQDRIEKIKINLEGELAKQYDVYYRVYSQQLGWLGWTKNGLVAGTSDFPYYIEAYQVRLIPKKFSFKEEEAYLKKYTPVYFSQKDSRWSNIVYGIKTMGGTGCTPTSLAMAFSGILGKQILPVTVANYLYYHTNEFNKKNTGASGYAIIYATNYYGIKKEEITSLDQLNSALKKGKIVYAAMQNGRFATPWYNHAIVVFGYHDGQTMAYDPLSPNYNGLVPTSLIWNERSRSHDDLVGGSALYALSK